MSDRFGLKIVSVLLGFFAWTYVNLIIPPTVRRTIPSAVEYRNMPDLMRITPQNPEVQVEIEGSRRDFIISGPQKVQVSVDLYNLRPGRAILPVKVIAASGLNVKTVNPPQIEVDAVALIRREFPVSAKIIGQPAEGYLAEEPRIEPEKVVLEGPETLLKSVKGCQIEILLDQVKNSISENQDVRAVLEVGVDREGLRMVPEKVRVDVTLKQGYPRKIVALGKPVFINKPPEGKKLENYVVAPEKLMITGPGRLIEQISELGYRPIDLGKISESASLPLKLEFPGEKVQVVGSAAAFIEIFLNDSRITRIESALPFELKKNDSQHATVSVSSYSLEVEGFLRDLDKIRGARLTMLLDTTKMSPGSYDVPLTVPMGLPDKVKVTRIIPETVKIEITEMKSSVEAPTSKIASGTEGDQVASDTAAPGN